MRCGELGRTSRRRRVRRATVAGRRTPSGAGCASRPAWSPLPPGARDGFPRGVGL